jgi:hypothetical protein
VIFLRLKCGKLPLSNGSGVQLMVRGSLAIGAPSRFKGHTPGQAPRRITVTEVGDAPLALHECCGIGRDECRARTNAEPYPVPLRTIASGRVTSSTASLRSPVTSSEAAVTP